MDCIAFDTGDHFFESALDGSETGLNLPAVEIGSVVSDFEFQGSHTRREPGFVTGIPWRQSGQSFGS